MENKIRYFTTRPWGFGSNMVNFLKTLFFCDQTQKKLIFQDRYNTIGPDYELFSVVEIPNFAKRTPSTTVIPIENFKTLVKYILYEKVNFYSKIKYIGYFLLGLKKQQFLGNFNFNTEINQFFKEKYKQDKTYLTNLWTYTNDVRMIFKEYEKQYGFENYMPDIAIQIRGGDKIQESLSAGIIPAVIDKYLEICESELTKIKKAHIEVYIMTDTYSYFTHFKNELEKKCKGITVKSLAIPGQEGYQQADFNSLSKQSKIDSYLFFLYELEMMRKAPICIGSFTSNIFFLSAMLKYHLENKFISVDVNMRESFI